MESANDPATDFPIQNLPFGSFRLKGEETAEATVGIAIGTEILDVAAAQRAGLFTGTASDAAAACGRPTLNQLMALGPAYWSALRAQTSRLLRADTPQGEAASHLADQLLVSMSAVEMVKPVHVGDFTDFLTSIYHATNAGKIVSNVDKLGLNFHYIPTAYHGRSSSLVLSGVDIPRPNGQIKDPTSPSPTFMPSERFDYELEVGFYVGQANAWGEVVSVSEADNYLFGISLVNDWSARDIQAWEMKPLGPFLSKSTATSISPWVITMEALAPFRASAFTRAPDDPAPLPHLFDQADQTYGNLDISLEIHYSSAQMRAQGIEPIQQSKTSTKLMYWTPAQMLAHHTSNGCNMQVGDLFASGTLSGPTNEERGCLLELSWGGREPFALPTGETRGFMEDGDEVIFYGYCEREGFRRIGLGSCRAMVSGPESP